MCNPPQNVLCSFLPQAALCIIIFICVAAGRQNGVFMNKKNKLTPRFYIALALFSLMGQIAWVVENMYLNVFMYKMFNASAADISAMVAASAVAATLTSLLIGALSDRVGKRRLFIAGGYILWGISLFGFALIRVDVLGAP